MADQQPPIKREEEYFKEIASSTAPVMPAAVVVQTGRGRRRRSHRKRSHRRRSHRHRR